MGLWQKLLGKDDADDVEFIRKYTTLDTTPIGEVTQKFEVYRAKSERQARAYLATRMVSDPRVRVVVETPEGAFTKDVRGVHGPFASNI